jgi:hypothetical protein
MEANTIQGALVIIGIVNGVRLLQEGQKTKNYWGFILFVVAIVSGILLGALRYFGLTIELGILAALGSSGLYRVGEKVGGIGK